MQWYFFLANNLLFIEILIKGTDLIILKKYLYQFLE